MTKLRTITRRLALRSYLKRVLSWCRDAPQQIGRGSVKTWSVLHLWSGISVDYLRRNLTRVSAFRPRVVLSWLRDAPKQIGQAAVSAWRVFRSYCLPGKPEALPLQFLLDTRDVAERLSRLGDEGLTESAE